MDFARYVGRSRVLMLPSPKQNIDVVDDSKHLLLIIFRSFTATETAAVEEIVGR